MVAFSAVIQNANLHVTNWMQWK